MNNWSDELAVFLFDWFSKKQTNKTVHTQNDNRKKLIILRECVWRRVRACVCVVLGGEASTTEIVAWIAMYLTGYSDYLIGFH